MDGSFGGRMVNVRRFLTQTKVRIMNKKVRQKYGKPLMHIICFKLKLGFKICLQCQRSPRCAAGPAARWTSTSWSGSTATEQNRSGPSQSRRRSRRASGSTGAEPSISSVLTYRWASGLTCEGSDEFRFQLRVFLCLPFRRFLKTQRMWPTWTTCTSLASSAAPTCGTRTAGCGTSCNTNGR